MTQKPKTHNGDLAHLPAALLSLTEQPRWVVWPWELRTTKGGKEKWTKPPRQPRDPARNACANDPDTWGSYDDAVEAVGAGAADGIGNMLLGSNIGAIDCDHCVDRANAKLDTWAEQLRDEAIDAYQEITVSGGGLRIIGTVNGPKVHRKFTFDRKTGAGVELYRNAARYITISGIELGGPCTELPPLDRLIDVLVRRYSGEARQGQGLGLDFNDAGPQASAIDYDDVIRNGAPEGERSELFQAVVWHLAGKGWTAEQITDELARHPNGIGAKYADRLNAEVERSYDKWRTRKRAAVTGSADNTAIGNPWSQIYVIAGEIPRVVNEAEDALLLLNREIYQRGGLVVRPVLSKVKAADDRDTESWRLVPMTRPYLVETLTRAAQFLKFNARSKAFVAIDAPDKVADAYLARVGDWRIPILAGIVNTPFLRADGSLCETPGYDAASGLLFKPEGASFPPIPQSATRAQAQAALDTIDALIETLPFVTPTDRSVALSAILTALDRRNMATAPMHALTAPAAGTGKTLLVDAVAVLATGRTMPVIAPGKNEEELEKRLGAAFLEGHAAVSIDNCEHPLQSSFLCQALTQERLNIRFLGLSKIVETPVNASIFATGNNLTIVGDLTRRTLLCSLDAQCERPELRTFDRDLLETARSDRSKLVAAALTVLRAWHVANERISLPPFGSFETWSRRVRQALVWLGRTDPCDTTAKVRSGDPHRTSLNTVLVQWHEHLGKGTFTVQEVIGRALVAADFQAALCIVAGNRAGNLVNNDRLGRWLKKAEGQIMNKLTLVQAGNRSGYPLWQVVEV